MSCHLPGICILRLNDRAETVSRCGDAERRRREKGGISRFHAVPPSVLDGRRASPANDTGNVQHGREETVLYLGVTQGDRTPSGCGISVDQLEGIPRNGSGGPSSSRLSTSLVRHCDWSSLFQFVGCICRQRHLVRAESLGEKPGKVAPSNCCLGRARVGSVLATHPSSETPPWRAKQKSLEEG